MCQFMELRWLNCDSTESPSIVLVIDATVAKGSAEWEDTVDLLVEMVKHCKQFHSKVFNLPSSG